MGTASATPCQSPEVDDDDCLGLTAKHNSDLNRDGWIGNQDFTFLVAVLMQKLGWPGSADYDGDGRLNFCDDDSGGDGLTDPEDCHLLDHTISDCDDQNPCTADSCVNEACVHLPAGGDACDDGDPCTVDDVCLSGVCAGAEVSCDDGNPCTGDLCDSGACTHLFNDSPCDDADACTPVDACFLGQCLGSGELDCDDGNFCTDDACDPATGCIFNANTIPCDDDDACTTGDACADSACVSGDPTDCEDLNPCTDDSCLPETGCGTTPVENGAACTQEGICVGACDTAECVDIALEVCDGEDNNCDGHVDETCVSVFSLTVKAGRSVGAVGEYELNMNTGLPVTGAAIGAGGSVHWGIGAIAVSAGQ